VKLHLALDFGGTKLGAGLVDTDAGSVLEHQRDETRAGTDARQSVDQILVMGRSLLAAARAAGHPPAGVGISFGGPVTADHRRVVTSHHVPGWDDFPLVDVVANALALPVALDNDANLQTLGEWRYGAGRGVSDFVFVNVGTGIGGGIILGGRLHRGRHGLAGEVGHTVVDPSGPLCTCGKHGCVESLASGPFVAAAARAALAQGAGPSTLANKPIATITGRDVYAAAAAGDALATRIVGQAAHYLGIGIANVCALVDPELVAVGGGVARSGETFFGPLVRSVQAHAAPLAANMVRVVPGLLGEDSNLLGAAALSALSPEGASD
jgi:glucokinase